ERAAWIAMGMGLLATTGGDLIYNVWLVKLDEVPFPSIADVFYLAWYPLSYVTVMLLLRARVPRFPASMWLDGAIGGLGLAACAAALVFQPILDASTGSFAAVATNLAYPISDFLLLVFVMAVFALTSWRPGRGWGLIAVGLVLNAVADSIYLVAVSKGTYVEGTVLDAVWPIGYAAIAWAAWVPNRPGRVRLGSWFVLFAPAIFSSTALGLLVYDHFHRVNTLAVVLATGTLVAAMVRTALTFVEVRALAESRRLAQTDDLTGLRNRRHLYARLEEALAEATVGDRSLSLLLIDLDRFKELNDTLGHHAGDLLLQEIGPRLHSAVPEADTIARLGGDEFAVLLFGPRGDLHGALDAGGRIRAALERPFEFEDLTLHIEGSIGIALHPDHASDRETLLQHADVAMYQAKSERSDCEVYAAERDDYSRERLTLMGELRRAIEGDELVVYYQPKADLRTGRVYGTEALVRWQHPARGLLGPHMFLPMAEQTGLMRPLTLYVLRHALAQCAAWSAAGRDLSVAVNLAAANLLDLELAGDVAELLDASGVPAERLQLEITENSVMADPVRAVEVLESLRALGIGISLDDFGTGYSSLAYLKRLAVDELKIDKSFVMDMTTDDDDAVIVRSTVDLAKNLSLRVVAEGVETQEAWDVLARMGCDFAQGFLLSKPVPPDELLAWILERDAIPDAAVTGATGATGSRRPAGTSGG
ncbi:MAG: hypothetical protein QOD45_324, partial [Pseudonocardiales bacterium]|nr:hypothetical protein [Pseudonocardiales bacterium]